jgi:hypothetical protein
LGVVLDDEPYGREPYGREPYGREPFGRGLDDEEPFDEFGMDDDDPPLPEPEGVRELPVDTFPASST